MRRAASVSVLMSWLGLAALPTSAIELGDPAPPLSVAKWLKGGPVNLADGKGKNVYVIEFWATWCPPCLKNIPRLTKLQRKHKKDGLVVIGVTQEPLPVAHAFVKQRGARMGYAVAADAPAEGRRHSAGDAKSAAPPGKPGAIGRSGKTTTAYMKALGLKSIPHVFIVDRKGRLAWHGYPEDMDKALGQVLAGTYNLTAAREADRERQLAAKVQPIAQEYFAIVQSDGDRKRAAKLGAQFVTEAREVPRVLEYFASGILAADGLAYRDRKLALRAAKSACEATGGQNARMLNTYARALFETGRVGEAIRYQKLAIRVTQDPHKRDLLERVLKYYQQAAAKTR